MIAMFCIACYFVKSRGRAIWKQKAEGKGDVMNFKDKRRYLLKIIFILQFLRLYCEVGTFCKVELLLRYETKNRPR